MSARRELGDRGSAAAEFAVALPAVAVVLLLGAGALSACALQVRLQDAAADAARLAARGDPPDRASVTAPGASIGISHDGDLVCATVTASPALPIGPLHATSCALDGGR